jgi:predicted transcriptional regulator
MTKNRSREDIAAEILKHALNGKKKTHLIFGAHLSFAQLTKYLELLLQHELLEHLPKEGIYRTTQKGKLFLQSYQEFWHAMFTVEGKAASRYVGRLR